MSTDIAGRPPLSPRRARTRARLVAAAREVFARRGVVGSTVEEICEEAGFTRGAFYSNFADKEELVAAVLEESGERIVGAAEQAASVRPVGSLEQVVESFFRMQPVDTLHYVMLSELTLQAIRDPEASDVYRRGAAQLRERVVDVLARGLEEIGREFVVDGDVLVEALTGVFERSVREALIDRDGEDPHRLARAALPGVILGLTRPRER